MREIKVRGWSEGKKKWIYGWGVAHVKLISSLAKSVGLEYVSYIYSDEGSCEVFTDSVGEYTGIHDMSNDEIFEGDLVKREFVAGYSIKEEFIGEVKMLEGQWVIDNGEETLPLWSEADELHIIGNTHVTHKTLQGLSEQVKSKMKSLAKINNVKDDNGLTVSTKDDVWREDDDKDKK